MTAKLLLAYLLNSTSVNGIPVDTSNIDPQEAYCLAENIYYEAKGEEIKGQFAVASVTINRAKDSRYPSTICGVISQSGRIKDRIVCAFSWYCESGKRGKEILIKDKDGSVNQRIADQFKTASIVAIKTLSGVVKDKTSGSTHFHNPKTSDPAWRHQLVRTISVGNHDFYRLK